MVKERQIYEGRMKNLDGNRACISTKLVLCYFIRISHLPLDSKRTRFKIFTIFVLAIEIKNNLRYFFFILEFTGA